VVKLKLEFWYCPFKDVDITNIGNVHYTYRAFHKLLNTVKVPISFKTVIYVFDMMKIYFICCCGNTNTYIIFKELCGYIYFLLVIHFSSWHYLRYFHWKSFKLNFIKLYYHKHENQIVMDFVLILSRKIDKSCTDFL